MIDKQHVLYMLIKHYHTCVDSVIYVYLHLIVQRPIYTPISCRLRSLDIAIYIGVELAFKRKYT